MKLTTILIFALATSVFMPNAAADDPCADLPDRNVQNACYQATKLTGSTEGCDGEGPSSEPAACLTTQSCPVSDGREPLDGCAGWGCKQVQSPPGTNGGANCLDVICKTVPPVFETIKVQTLGVAGILGLGSLPGGEVLVRVLKNAAITCEPAPGGSGSGSGCQRVLTTPVGSAGLDPDAVVTMGGETGTECSWAQSGTGGYTYVGTNGTEFALLDGNCKASVRVHVVLGGSGETYQVDDSCAA